MRPGRRTWAACTDSRRLRWTTGRARAAGVRAFPTMGLARRRNAETRLTAQRLQRSSGRVIGLFDGAHGRRAGALDGARSRRRHGRHGPCRVRARVAHRVRRGRERAALGCRWIWRAAAQGARGIRGRRGGGQVRPGAARGHVRRDREAAVAPRRLHGAVARRMTQGGPLHPARRVRRGDRRARRRGRTGGGRCDAQRSGRSVVGRARKAPKPSRPPTTSAAAAVAASSDPVAASPARAARLFWSLGIRAVLPSRRATRRAAASRPVGQMSQR